MKNAVVLVMVMLIGFSCTKQTDVIVEGEGFEEFEKVTLKYHDPEKLEYVFYASKPLAANKDFKFTIPYKNANIFELSFDDKEFIPISVEAPGTIKLIRTDQETSIEGSPSTAKLTTFKNQNDSLQAKYFGQLKVDMDSAMQEKDQERINEIMKRSELAITNYLQEFRALIESFGTTPAGYYALQFSDFNKELDFIEKRLVAYKKDAPKSLVTLALGKQLQQAKATLVGNIPPAFKARNSKGDLVSLEDFKGKMLLIDFWAAWCRACRVENPKLASLYKESKAKNFEIISISQDETEENWIKAMKKDGINEWHNIWDQDKSISNLYSVSSLPQNLLLDIDGKIIAKNLSADDLSKIIAAELN